MEFACWNDEIIRTAFIIDALDLEIVALAALSGAGISDSDVRDMVLEAIEKRFGAGTRSGTPMRPCWSPWPWRRQSSLRPALRQARLGHVLIVILGFETCLALLCAWLLFRETYAAHETLGLALIILGIVVAHLTPAMRDTS